MSYTKQLHQDPILIVSNRFTEFTNTVTFNHNFLAPSTNKQIEKKKKEEEETQYIIIDETTVV